MPHKREVDKTSDREGKKPGVSPCRVLVSRRHDEPRVLLTSPEVANNWLEWRCVFSDNVMPNYIRFFLKNTLATLIG